MRGPTRFRGTGWMSSFWFRLAVAALLVFVVTVPYWYEATDSAVWSFPLFGHLYDLRVAWSSSSDTAGIAIIGSLFFVAGLLIGRWWALLLIPLPYLLTLPLGEIPGDSDHWTYSFAILVEVLFAGSWALLIGLVTRLLVDRRRSGQSGGALP